MRFSRQCLLFLIPLLMLLCATPCAADWTRNYTGINSINAIIPLSPDGFVAIAANNVLRLDSRGRILWEISLQGEGYELYFEDGARLPEGDIIVAGTSWDFNGSPFGLVIRLDDTGHLIWTRKLAGIHTSRLESVVISGEGLVMTLGTLDPAGETEALLLAAFDPSGGIEWARAFDSVRSHGWRIDLASNGDLLVAGARIFQPLFTSYSVNKAFLLRLRPDSTSIWGLYSPGLSDPQDNTFSIPMAVVEQEDGGLLVGLLMGSTGMSGSTTAFWTVSSQGYLDDSWGAPGMETVQGGFSRPTSGEGPVLFGRFSNLQEGGWIWAGPSLEGGSWARSLIGPLGMAALWSGCSAENGDLVFSGWSNQPGAMIWRTSPEGLMPNCGLTRDIPVPVVLYSPELYHGSADLSSLPIVAENFPLSVENAGIQTSFICGETSAAPRIPTLNSWTLLLFALCLIVAALTILRPSRL